jgi:hypothetical protein
MLDVREVVLSGTSGVILLSGSWQRRSCRRYLLSGMHGGGMCALIGVP